MFGKQVIYWIWFFVLFCFEIIFGFGLGTWEVGQWNECVSKVFLLVFAWGIVEMFGFGIEPISILCNLGWRVGHYFVPKVYYDGMIWLKCMKLQFYPYLCCLYLVFDLCNKRTMVIWYSFPYDKPHHIPNKKDWDLG